MRILFKGKDGGDESTVTGYWLLEWKAMISIVLLKFDGKSRDAWHTHAFNSLAWVVKGELTEEFINGYKKERKLRPRWRPYLVTRKDFHKVSSLDGVTWVVNIRGPWSQEWLEHTIEEGTYTLQSGRVRK